MENTYALFDVIGIKTAFKAGTAPALLDEFWKTADAWTNAGGHGMVTARDGFLQEADPQVVTFSDSALLRHDPEIQIDDFWKLVRRLKSAIDRAAGRSYVIVSRGEAVDHHDLPALGGTLVRDGRPRYFNAGGSGPAFANLFLAEQAIREAGWREYAEYAVGTRSMPGGARAIKTTTFRALKSETIEVFAIG